MKNVAKINLEVLRCPDCPFARQYEKRSGYFCVHELKNVGLPLDDPERIPDFCPFVLERLKKVISAMDEVSDAALPKKWLKTVEQRQKDDPDPKFGADHGFLHAERVRRYAEKFLEDCVEYGFSSPDTIQKEQLLLGIAARLHDVGLADSSRNHAIHSAELAKKYLASKKIDIDENDAYTITHAIYNHSNGAETRTIIDAALILGDKLDVAKERIIRVTDKITAELTKVEKVEFRIVGKNKVASKAELVYTTAEDFDVSALKMWPKCVEIPRKITEEYLGLSSFKFTVNGKVIDF